MINVILHGSKGRMGSTLEKIITETNDMHITAGIDHNIDGSEHYKGFTDIGECPLHTDVIIDFSNHAALHKLLYYAQLHHTPIVLATTAFTKEECKSIMDASKKIPIFHSANMSIGINGISKILETLVPLLEQEFHIEIIEKHHSKKLDAPSGTAILLADAINSRCSQKKEYVYGRHGNEDCCDINQMGIHSVRGGTIPGEHSIIFAGPDEIIEIKHTALSRNIFALGALRAARFIVEQNNGLFSMADLI